jgi:hypothetical protein
LDEIDKDCSLTCGENEYPSGGTCVEITCHHCAKDGFPYCFPIDFSSTCGSIPSLIEGPWVRPGDDAPAIDKTCRVNPDVLACSNLYNDAQMAQFAESQTKCESQEVYWAICEKR